MVLLKSCCCWKSVRSGSFASGIYTMAFYTIVVTAGSFHVESVINLPVFLPVLLTFSVLMLIFAALSVLTSVLLIVGLCTDNRLLLIPWIVCVTLTTIVDVILSLYLLTDSDEIDPFFGFLVITDIFICILNVYCILCVASQYQELLNGRNQARQIIVDAGLPAIHLDPPSVAVAGAMNSPSPKVTISLIPNNGPSPSTSGRRPLLSTSRYRPSSLATSSSPILMMSRSSFSSTSEISICSSDTLPGSRRGSALPLQEVARPGMLSPVGEIKSVVLEEPSPTVEEEGCKTTVVEIDKEGDNNPTPALVSPGILRFSVSSIFSSSIFRQTKKRPILEKCDPADHPLSCVTSDDATSIQPEKPSVYV